MSTRSFIDQAIELAKLGGTVLPGLGGGAAIAEKLLDVLDGLKPHADTGQKAEIEETHEQLYKRVTDAGHSLSDRLRG